MKLNTKTPDPRICGSSTVGHVPEESMIWVVSVLRGRSPILLAYP